MLKISNADADLLLVENTHPIVRSNYYPVAHLALIVCDVAAAVLAFVTAYWLRFDMNIALSRDIMPEVTKYFWLIVLLIPLWVGLFAAMRLYDFRTLLGGTSEYARAERVYCRHDDGGLGQLLRARTRNRPGLVATLVAPFCRLRDLRTFCLPAHRLSLARSRIFHYLRRHRGDKRRGACARPLS